MVRGDAAGFYHGHGAGVTMYDLDAGKQWHQPTDGAVLFGWQEADTVYAGTSNKKVHCFSKQGQANSVYRCDDSVYSCATAEKGKYVFAGDSSSSIYCFTESGDRIWKLGTGYGSALSMQFSQEHLYIVTTEGVLACIDATEAAIKAAQSGELPETVNIKAPPTNATSVSTVVETTSDATSGVIVECFEDGSKLRVRVVSPGYHPDWMVQFPQNIREKKTRYLVQEIRESSHGCFYRAYGDIKKLI